MLNISDNSINRYVSSHTLRAFTLLGDRNQTKFPAYLIGGILLVFIITLFLPWRQNIQTKGYLTTLRPDQKPQAIQSVISGRMEKWYVREGDFVEAGDTILYISEIKSEYFDPDLIARASEQVTAKSQSIQSYDDKVNSLNLQYQALTEARQFKLEQTRNKIEQTKLKIESDSIDLVAYERNLDIAQKQYNRTNELYDRGLKSLTELEGKALKLQESQAKVTVQQNKLLTQKNELLNLRIQLPAIESEYADKLAKSQSDKFTALANKLDASASTSKLRNSLSNYSQRQNFYYIKAPQAGYITKAIKKGIGEIVKEGTDIVTIMPAKYDLAVEVYVEPQDLPLLSPGKEVRLLFDGWPAVVFSGWPNASVGTFSGEVFAIDQFISDNGKYRLLVAPMESEKSWPELIRVGSGARALILLNEVPLWYEVWRQLNGFPPDFYNEAEKEQEEIKLKAPLKSVK